MRISVITYAAFWPLLINTIYGVRAIDPQALTWRATSESPEPKRCGASRCRRRWRASRPASASAPRSRWSHDHDELIAGNKASASTVSQDGTGEPPAADVRAILLTGIPRLPAEHVLLHARAPSSSGRRRRGNG